LTQGLAFLEVLSLNVKLIIAASILVNFFATERPRCHQNSFTLRARFTELSSII